MANRRMQDSDYLFESEDDPIGLTSAFAPVKGPQSVEYDVGDEAIGLTGAFEPIPDQDEPRAWDEAGKWRDFDWNASIPDEQDYIGEGGVAEGEGALAEDTSQSAGEGAVDKSAAETPQTQSTASAGASHGSGRGRHAAPDIEMSPRMQQAKKTRRRLLVLVILLIIVVGVVVFFMYRTFSSSQEEAAQQAQQQIEEPKDSLASNPADDAGDAPAKLTDVPVITSLFGLTTDEAIEKIGHGALVTSNREVNEEGNPVKTNLNVALTDEPNDSKTGFPTVYLGLDQNGNVVQVGYSASASALGFGSLSFADAVNDEHVIEKTMAKVGVTVPEGSAVLPADKDEYSTYATDGTTVTRERCSFEGDVDVNGAPCTWSSVLSYDYTTQVVTGNLSDTVRVIYVYVTEK